MTTTHVTRIRHDQTPNTHDKYATANEKGGQVFVSKLNNHSNKRDINRLHSNVAVVMMSAMHAPRHSDFFISTIQTDKNVSNFLIYFR